METGEARDLGRLALVAGTALAFATVAIPLQLRHQWITIGWALGRGRARLATVRRIPHRGLLLWASALLADRVRPAGASTRRCSATSRAAARIFNWYLYTYLIAARVDASGGLLALDDGRPHRRSAAARVGAASGRWSDPCCSFCSTSRSPTSIATGQAIAFRFGVTVARI